VDTSLKSLRETLLALRSWDSTGKTQDNRIRKVLNVALDRLAGEVPEALIPDEEHVFLNPETVSTDTTVASIAKIAPGTSSSISDTFDTRVIEFFDTAGTPVAHTTSKTTWYPIVTREHDGIMHIELTNKTTGHLQRRQCVEFFSKRLIDPLSETNEQRLHYYCTLDRPVSLPVVDGVKESYDFRIFQPEFFVRDDVMEVLEPAVIYDESRQQVWKIDTAGASRQDMLDYKGNSKGRPYRFWRGRHFQMQAPTEAPFLHNVINNPDAKEMDNKFDWLRLAGQSGIPRGRFAICYTYVWGRRDFERQKAPGVAPGSTAANSGYENLMDFGGAIPTADQNDDLVWSYADPSIDPMGTTTDSEQLHYSGIPDPQWESAPSPVSVIDNRNADNAYVGNIMISAPNIDGILGFGDENFIRYKKSGLRIRYYVSVLDETEPPKAGAFPIETNERFYLLCEVEPTYNQYLDDSRLTGVTAPDSLTINPQAYSLVRSKGGALIFWNGSQQFDYHRPLKHSTGYYAYKCYPHQDDVYELDLRVLRLPKKFIDDQDTAPIQRDAVSSLIELALYYVSLHDGNDQASAQAHLSRYQDLVKIYRERYANPGGIVEPVPFTGYRGRTRYGTFGSLPLDD
jgi:hypothetical protein